MFDHIAMYHHYHKVAVGNQNIAQLADEKYLVSVADALQSQFNMSGDFAILLPHPTSEYTKENHIFFQLFTYMESDSNYYTRRQNYNSFLLMYTYSGQGVLNYKGKKYHLRKGDCFLIDCRELHEYYTEGTSWHHSDLHFWGKPALLLYKEFTDLGTPVFQNISSSIYNSRLDHILEIYTKPSAHRDIIISSNIAELVAFIIEKCDSESLNTSPDAIRYLVKYMESNYMKPLDLNELSRFSGLSKYHMSREFKKYTGYSPHNYLIEQRLSHAKMLLESTSLAASKIGALVGIADEHRFFKLFKERTGMTPSEYRKR